MAVLAALDEVEDQVSDVEGSTPHSTAVVPSQRLLVLGRAEECNVARFIQLVHGILEGLLGSLFIMHPDPWCSIVEVGREARLGLFSGSRAPREAQRPIVRQTCSTG